MPRLPFPDTDSAPAAIREALRANPLSLLRMAAHAEGAFDAWLNYLYALFTQLELDPLLRELAILQVARLTSSRYEWVQHAPVARANGVSDEQIEAIEAGADDHRSFSEKQSLLLRFTREAVVEGAASEHCLEELARRLGPRQVVELLLVIGQYMALARLIASTGLAPDPPNIATGVLEGLQE